MGNKMYYDLSRLLNEANGSDFGEDNQEPMISAAQILVAVILAATVALSVGIGILVWNLI